MTTELQQYQCPSCGHVLGQLEYLHACEKLQEQLTQKLQQRDEQHAKEMQHKNEEFKQKIESTVNFRISKERKELAEERSKFKQEIEMIRRQAVIQANERIRQALSEKEEELKQEVSQYKLQIARQDDKYRKLELEFEKSKRLDNISSESKGTAGENGLLEELKQEFKTDEFICKKNGVAMADILHTIVTEKGERIATKIAYDKKTSSKVTRLDLEKAKNYKRIHKTDYCIIVTNHITGENRFTEVREGVLLVRPRAIVDMS